MSGLLHRHRWRWAGKHVDPAAVWDLEACCCGERRRVHYSRLPTPDGEWTNSWVRFR